MGGRSRAAAQLLAGKGFKEVYNLKGGIMAWQGLTAAGPAEMGMVLVKGDETPEEIIITAYGMETGLEEFYVSLAREAEDPDVADLLGKLGRIEEKHKESLFRLYLTFDTTPSDREAFEGRIIPETMEGGFTTQEFLEENRPAMQTLPDIIAMAMMLETQALDLYLRYSQKTRDENTNRVLYEIAEEEKAHLATLGRLMEEKA
jgi:rubrerythrin